MKKSLVLVLLIAALIVTAAPVSADYYATKRDYLAGKLTPGQSPVPKAGGDDCTNPPRITGNGSGMVMFTDSGDTTGGTSNVNAVPNACTGTVFDGNASGPDHIWVFDVGTSNMLTFRVTTPSNLYDPMMYALATCGDGLGSCRIGTDNCLNADLEDPVNPCQGMSTEQMVHSFNTPGTYYLYVDSWYTVAGSPTQAQGPYDLTVTGDFPVELLKFTVD